MTLPTPLEPATSPPPTRRLLGHLTGQLSRRRPAAPRAADPTATVTDDTGWWELVRGDSGALSADAARAHPPAAGVASPVVRSAPAGVDGWLTARERSGPVSAATPEAAGAPVPVPVPVPAAAPVRVPVWPAWVGSTSALPTGEAAPPVPVDTSVTATVPSVVRVSGVRPAPVRAPVPRSGAVAASPTPSTVPTPPSAVPASGVELALTDGRRVPLTSTVLVGRNPAPRAGETVGALVAVEDPARSVSKTHLVVGVDDGGVWVVDRGSTNGTVVTLPDGQRILCVPERRVRLVAGASVGFGDHGFTLAAVAEPGRPG